MTDYKAKYKELRQAVSRLLAKMDADIYYDSGFDCAEEIGEGGSHATKSLAEMQDAWSEVEKILRKDAVCFHPSGDNAFPNKCGEHGGGS